MKKGLLVVLVLTAALVVWLSLPLTSVAVLTVTVTDQNDSRIESGVKATYFDGNGKPIVTITPQTRGSWDNNLHWWSHSSHNTSNLRPEDALRAVSVRIEAEGCSPSEAPVKLQRSYEPLSLFPHGGGAAYFLYSFSKGVVLQCS